MKDSYIVLDNSFLPTNHIHFKYLLIIFTFFVSTWLIANIAAVKLVSIFGITFTGGFFIFPFTTMLGIVLVEVYGYKNARQAIWCAIFMNIAFTLFINLANIIPASPVWKLNNEFKNILVPGTRITLASSIAFVLSEFLNSYIMAKLKYIYKGKSLAKRVLISSSSSAFLDLFLFLILAFYGVMPNKMLLALIIIAYIKRELCQIILFPFTCHISSLLKKFEGTDLYDNDTKFTPFSLDNVYSLKKST